MRARPSSTLLPLALAALVAGSAPRAVRADEPAPAAKPPRATSKSDEASQRFKSGVAFYKDKDFAAALVEFKRAYELVPHHNVLYNLGQTARELKDHAAALSAYERYLRDGGAKIPAPRRKEVTTAIEELRHKVGRIKVATSVEGAEVGVDDVPVGASPLAEPVVVNAGRRKVSARASGYAPAQQMVEVASMEETSVSLDLVRLDPGTPRVGPVARRQAPPLVAWVTLAAGGACLVAAAVTGGLAVSAHKTLDSALGTFPGDPKAIADAQARTRSFAIATDVLGGLAVVGAVATTVLFVVPLHDPEKTSVAVSPGGVVVKGVF